MKALEIGNDIILAASLDQDYEIRKARAKPTQMM